MQNVVKDNDLTICRHKNCHSLCVTDSIDSVLNYRNGSIYAFKGNFFWPILDTSVSPTEQTAKKISDYWNPNNNSKSLFLGPIDAALKDDNGFTYLFKLNTVYTFKEFEFIGSQKVDAFKSIDSILMTNFSKDYHMVYIFKDNNYWQIFPIYKMYNWTEMGDIYQKMNVKRIHRSFPVNIDATFEDNDNNVILISGENYMKIESNKFTTAIQESDFEMKFIYKDILNCKKSFYNQTIYRNYDQFIVSLITEKFGFPKQLRNEPLAVQCVDNQSAKQTNNWSKTLYYERLIIHLSTN
ncbi:uncharacterized protein LOC128963640 [Oppia nitens]|uniref:uncharacterized protein LOC128963640 n=1 Tax=Oppia nitens TaxID=1686743 RepID=UPI0023DA1335|nr:uncharacterized protein LOC128963640 [Oppia nitens]